MWGMRARVLAVQRAEGQRQGSQSGPKGRPKGYRGGSKGYKGDGKSAKGGKVFKGDSGNGPQRPCQMAMTPECATVLLVHLVEVKFVSGLITGGGSKPSAAEPQVHGGSQR